MPTSPELLTQESSRCKALTHHPPLRSAKRNSASLNLCLPTPPVVSAASGEPPAAEAPPLRAHPAIAGVSTSSPTRDTDGAEGLSQAVPRSLSRSAHEELARRHRVHGFRPGGWHDDGQLLLFGVEAAVAIVVTGGNLRAWIRPVCSPHWHAWDPDHPTSRPALAELLAQDDTLPQAEALADGWLTTDRQLRLPFDEEANAYNERCVAVAALLRWASPWSTRILEQFPNAQWRMLAFLSVSGDAGADLCKNDPALGFMLAHGRTFGCSDGLGRLLPVIAAAKRKRILAVLGFSRPSAAVAKLLRKLPAENLHEDLLLRFRTVTSSASVVKRLSHLESLNRAVIEAFPDPPDLIRLESGLLEELVRSGSRRRARRVRRTCRLLHQARRLGYRCPRVLSSLRMAAAEYADTRRLLRMVAGIPAAHPLPPPPVRGVPAFIEPIRTSLELIDEARAMHHCAFSYVPLAVAGTVSFFRVLQPRLTLGLVQIEGRWALHDVRGTFNDPDIGLQCANRLDAWLNAAGVAHSFTVTGSYCPLPGGEDERPDGNVPF